MRLAPLTGWGRRRTPRSEGVRDSRLDTDFDGHGQPGEARRRRPLAGHCRRAGRWPCSPASWSRWSSQTTPVSASRWRGWRPRGRAGRGRRQPRDGRRPRRRRALGVRKDAAIARGDADLAAAPRRRVPRRRPALARAAAAAPGRHGRRDARPLPRRPPGPRPARRAGPAVAPRPGRPPPRRTPRGGTAAPGPRPPAARGPWEASKSSTKRSTVARTRDERVAVRAIRDAFVKRPGLTPESWVMTPVAQARSSRVQGSLRLLVGGIGDHVDVDAARRLAGPRRRSMRRTGERQPERRPAPSTTCVTCWASISRTISAAASSPARRRNVPPSELRQRLGVREHRPRSRRRRGRPAARRRARAAPRRARRRAARPRRISRPLEAGAAADRDQHALERRSSDGSPRRASAAATSAISCSARARSDGEVLGGEEAGQRLLDALLG